MRKAALIIAPPLVGLLAWLFLSWPELPQARQPAAEASGEMSTSSPQADAPAAVPEAEAEGPETTSPPVPVSQPLPPTGEGEPVVAASDEADDADQASPPARPGERLAELQRRALAGEPKAMRDWVDALEQCAALLVPPHDPDAARHVDLLSEDWAARWQQQALPLLAPLADDCHTLFPEQDRRRAMERWRALRSQALAALATDGDPLAQLLQDHLRTRGAPTPEQWHQRQSLAVAALDPANPQSLVDLGRMARYLSRFDSEAAWQLVACDLGLDCSADGVLMRQNCLAQGLCVEGDYESALLRLLPPREWSRAQAQRQALREAIARGERASLFDRPPPRPPGGG